MKGQDENSETYTCANYLFSQMNVVSMCVEFNTIIIIDEGLYVCFCSSCKAQCAHPSEARYSAIKITLMILLLLFSSSSKELYEWVKGRNR